ncbi:lipase family protein [Nocardia coubleae]|uniref:lipase family protein n=1 Tax=Nocardia coubleae TaxID=356147 RepID=UPI000AB11090|nr:lipase family protein [Nocardia coubleae]
MKGRPIRRFLAVLATTAAVGVSSVAVAVADPADPAPGTVVSTGPLPSVAEVPGAAKSQRVTYWTRTNNDAPAQSTGAIFLPAGSPPAGGWPVVSWEHGTVGLADHCQPSVAGRIQRDNDYLSHWLGQGYAIVATDYLSVNGVQPYLDGRAEAHSGIDMVRAARSIEPSLSSKWVAIGQSQGGGAAVWTASMATRYAPELDYRGAVATGPASHVVEEMILATSPAAPTIANPHTNVYPAFVLAALHSARPDFEPDYYLTPRGKDVVRAATTVCLDQLVDVHPGATIKDLFARPLSEGNFAEIGHQVFDVPVTGYDRPLFIGQGLADTDVIAPGTMALIAELEANGTHPEAHFYPGKDHSATVNGSLPDSTPFVARLLA